MTPFTGRNGELEKLLAPFERAHRRRQRAGSRSSSAKPASASRGSCTSSCAPSRARNVLALDGGAAPYGSGAGYRPGVHILRQYFNIAETDDVRALQEKVAGRIVALDGDSNTVGAPLLALLRALPDNHRFFGLPVERAPAAGVRRADVARRPDDGRSPARARLRGPAVGDVGHARLSRRLRRTTLPPSTLVLLTYRPDYDAGWLADRERLELRARRPRAGRDAPDHHRPAGRRRIARRAEGRASAAAAAAIRCSSRNTCAAWSTPASCADSRDATGSARGATPATIPPTVRGGARRAHRPPGARRQARAADARGGRRGRHASSLLERVSGMPADELRKSLRRLEMAGLLVERADAGELAYEFKHSLTQAVAYDTLLHERRQRAAPRHPDARSATAASSTSSRATRCWARPGTRRSPTCAMPAAWPPRTSRASRRSPTSSARSTCSSQLAAVAAARAKWPSTCTATCATRSSRSARTSGCWTCCRRRARLAEELGDERRLAQVLSFLSNYYGNVGRLRSRARDGRAGAGARRARRRASTC